MGYIGLGICKTWDTGAGAGWCQVGAVSDDLWNHAGNNLYLDMKALRAFEQAESHQGTECALAMPTAKVASDLYQ